jgi:hypothetical protein
MPEIKHILILANSEREGGRCIAGKLVARLEGDNLDVSPQWIRLNNPSSSKGGAVPWQHAKCHPNGAPVRPLDIIKVSLLDQCNNPDHPEDWNYDPNVPWERVASAKIGCLTAILDTPQSLWHDGSDKAVHAGYIRKMAQPASLYLIKAPNGWSFEHFKEWNQTEGYDKKRRRLKMIFGGKYHDFAVTDSEFDKRFKLPAAASHWPNSPTLLAVPNADGVYLCLSLTGLTPPNFISHHYKICATIFES